MFEIGGEVEDFCYVINSFFDFVFWYFLNV